MRDIRGSHGARGRRSAAVALCIAAAVALLASATTGCHDRPPASVAFHTPAGEVRIEVEIASTEPERARGLMWRDDLAEDQGMLFLFPSEKPLSFWMKNTPLSLDIIFVSSDRRVVSIAAATTPYSTEPIPSRRPARYVVETRAGFCAENGVTVGTPVELPAVLPTPR